MDAISDLALFRAIVDAGGISAAAVVLQSSPAAVSRRLSALESKLGVRLADRSSRRFRLTDEGLLLYERSCSILDQIRDAEAEVASYAYLELAAFASEPPQIIQVMPPRKTETIMLEEIVGRMWRAVPS